MEIGILRLVHIVFGFFWAAGAVIMGFFVIPAVFEAGPGAAGVTRGIVGTRKLPPILIFSGLLSVLAGLRLYQLRFSMDWLVSAEGIVITLGGLLAIAALIMGIAVQRPTAMRLMELGTQIQASGAPPTAEQAAEMAKLQARMLRLGKVMGGHLAAAVVLMASIRLAKGF